MAEDSFTGKERELSRTLVPGTNTIPQILPPPQQIGASSLNQVHRQHCNINDFSETHRTRRCSCNSNQWVQRPTCKLPTHSNCATGVPHLQLLRLTSCCGGIHLEHLDREAVREFSDIISGSFLLLWITVAGSWLRATGWQGCLVDNAFLPTTLKTTGILIC